MPLSSPFECFKRLERENGNNNNNNNSSDLNKRLLSFVTERSLFKYRAKIIYIFDLYFTPPSLFSPQSFAGGENEKKETKKTHPQSGG